jgi:hypothetical protein
VDTGHYAARRKFDALKLELGSSFEEIYDSRKDPDGHVFLDCWPLPDPSSASKFRIFTALTWGAGSALHTYDWDSAAKTFVRENWRIYRDDMWSQVRVVKPAAPLPDDPDKNEMPTEYVNNLPLFYATLGGDGEGFGKKIWVLAFNKEYYVQVGMSGCYGIAVDPHFLWMYGRDGFACATHASVLATLKNDPNQQPNWLGNGQSKNISRTLALSPCEDGTLFVLASGNVAKTAPYHIEFNRPGVGQGEWLVIDEDWEPVIGAGGIECQKLPVFGWARVQGLVRLLSKPSPKLTLSRVM